MNDPRFTLRVEDRAWLPRLAARIGPIASIEHNLSILPLETEDERKRSLILRFSGAQPAPGQQL
jgi:hypothetical protein